MLEGRDREIRDLLGLIDAARSHRSSAVLLRGGAGIGKSALLTHVAQQVEPPAQVLWADGTQSEVRLPFAGLHQLLHLLLPALELVPDRQADALRGAFGMNASSAEPLLVGLAVLALLTRAARQAPVLVVVDDAHWMDEESAAALAFAARRLRSARVAMVFAVCDEETLPVPVSGARELRLGPLPTALARRLLDQHAPRAAPSVYKRLLTEAEGNPLALAELPAALSDEQLTGAQALPDQLPLSERVRQIFCRRAAAYGFPLLLAAAERDGELRTLLNAADDADTAMDVLNGAAEAGLITVRGERVSFSHPLVRSATYQAAAPSRRRAAHRALAGALDQEDDRRVWHLAACATPPDDTVARLLAGLADRTRRSGGVASAVRALRRAAALSSIPAATARWLVEAAECAWAAAEPAQAQALLAEAELLERTTELQARVACVRGTMLHAGSAPALACDTLLHSARLARSHAPQLAEECLLLAARAAWGASHPAKLTEIAGLLALLPLEKTTDRSQRLDQLRSMGDVGRGEEPAGEPAVRCSPPSDGWAPTLGLGPVVWPPVFLPYLMGDGEAGLDAQRRSVDALRASGASGALPVALTSLVAAQLVTGRWAEGAALGEQALTLAAETGQSIAACHLQALLACMAAAQGDSARCHELAEASLAVSMPRRAASAAAIARWAQGLDALSSLRPRQAVGPLSEVTAPGGTAEHFMLSRLVIPDLVEALVRVGQRDRAGAALLQFEERAAPQLSPSLRAAWHRCKALLAPAEKAGHHFADALAAPCVSGFETGRTHLLYGQWLRRHHEIKSARHHLHQAVEHFRMMRATPWTQQAHTELRAAGVLDATPPTSGQDLTPRELQIARYAAQGLTNKDIGSRLFLSPRTVGYHLYRIYPKLNITSRRQLQARLPNSSASPDRGHGQLPDPSTSDVPTAR
ncbi:AAA family ATPase [Streptomyces sp. NPDC090053]|uniref:helix-turn-helix transcriptional regulator n=1 Tax=Streptomyces sp. NPDC090053 TaxID=3365932 RepID=UPI0038181384